MNFKFVVRKGTEATEQYCGGPPAFNEIIVPCELHFKNDDLVVSECTDSNFVFSYGFGGYLHVLKKDTKVYDCHGAEVVSIVCPVCEDTSDCTACNNKGYWTRADRAAFKAQSKRRQDLIDQADFNLLG
jgi:hypothetical protein